MQHKTLTMHAKTDKLKIIPLKWFTNLISKVNIIITIIIQLNFYFTFMAISEKNVQNCNSVQFNTMQCNTIYTHVNGKERHAKQQKS